MTAKEKAIEAAKALYSAGTLSQEDFDTLLAGLATDHCVEMPLGTLVVKVAESEDHPGLYIDLRKPCCDNEPEGTPDVPLVMVEYTSDDPNGKPNVITRVWGIAPSEDEGDKDFTDIIIHQGLAQYFES